MKSVAQYCLSAFTRKVAARHYSQQSPEQSSFFPALFLSLALVLFEDRGFLNPIAGGLDSNAGTSAGKDMVCWGECWHRCLAG